MASGIVLRAIAPLLLGKRVDPAVLAVDLKGRYFVPLLAGHLGGANPLARHLAEVLGGEAVLTTGTDALGVPAPDLLAKALGARVPDWRPLKEVSALLVDGRPVGFWSDCVDLTPLGRYPGVRLLEAPRPDGVEGMVLFTVRKPFPLPVPALFAHPPALVLGLGCNRGTPLEEIREGVQRFLEEGGFAREALGRLATAEIKRDEEGLLAFAKEAGLPVSFHPAEVLNAQRIPTIPRRRSFGTRGYGGWRKRRSWRRGKAKGGENQTGEPHPGPGGPGPEAPRGSLAVILLAAHGSPDPRAQALARGLRKGLERRLGEEVLLGFIEHERPTLLEAALALGPRGGAGWSSPSSWGQATSRPTSP